MKEASLQLWDTVKGLDPLAWVASAAILIALVEGALLIRVRWKNSKSQTKGIRLRVEVLSGRLRSKRRRVTLSDELLIGRSRKCDISTPCRDVSAKNSRLFLQHGAIYIEDLNSKNGTAISNMRIHSPNKLQSGDEIRIGELCFKLMF